MQKTHPIDKSQWAPGPWMEEPDRVDFEHAGFPCLLLRGPMGTWCGYVGLPPTHPWYGKDYMDLEVDVHGGLTYAGRCRPPICHDPKPGEPDDVYWLGFDCGHFMDLIPGIEAVMRKVRGEPNPGAFLTAMSETALLENVYRDLAYVRRETEHLAEQVAAQPSRSSRIKDFLQRLLGSAS